MRILYLGDIHCNFNLVNQYLNLYKIKDAHIIQVGDFGVGFKPLKRERNVLEILNTSLKKKNVILYAIRGNHDNPKYFENDPFELSNIKLVKDYTVLELEGKRILCIGGACSIDRNITKTKEQKNGNYDFVMGQEWFYGEEFKYDDSKLVDLRNINIVVTHTAPDYCNPDNGNGFGAFVDRYIKDDPTLGTDLIAERRDMTLAFQTIKMYNDITLHLYGHFHRSDYTTIGGTQHRVLGIGELWEER